MTRYPNRKIGINGSLSPYDKGESMARNRGERLLRYEGVTFIRYVHLIREAKFEEAIPFIIRSIEFYSKHPWIDKYRFLLMISSSELGIMEMSLCNLAYCHLQIGEVNVAKQMYEDVLRQYPENPIAKVQLATINIVASNSIVE